MQDGAGDVCRHLTSPPRSRHLWLFFFFLVLDGMFVILVPAALTPLIGTLLWAEKKAKKLGIIPAGQQRDGDATDRSFAQRCLRVVSQLDLVGLVLLGAAVALLLLPLTLSQTVHNQWRNGPFNPHCTCKFMQTLTGQNTNSFQARLLPCLWLGLSCSSHLVFGTFASPKGPSSPLDFSTLR